MVQKKKKFHGAALHTSYFDKSCLICHDYYTFSVIRIQTIQEPAFISEGFLEISGCTWVALLLQFFSSLFCWYKFVFTTKPTMYTKSSK